MIHVVIPAKGVSTRLKRKNLRAVGTSPMVARTIALAYSISSSVHVSTDDPVIAAIARIHGANVIHRPKHLSSPDATVAQVVSHACEFLPPGDIAVLQPTSPTLQVRTCIAMLAHFNDMLELTSMSTAVRESHLLWHQRKPLYTDRVNSQYNSQEVHRETGGLHLVRREYAEQAVLVTDTHMLWEVAASEAIDIDTHDELVAARRIAEQKTVLFVVAGGYDVGTGHVRRCIAIADELPPTYNVCFTTYGDCDTEWIEASLNAAGYVLNSFATPDVVVVDALDVGEAYVAWLRSQGAAAIILLECMSTATKYADYTINELYDAPLGVQTYGDVAIGPRYAVMKPEFTGLPFRERTSVDRIFISFGGSDPSNLTDSIVSLMAQAFPDIEVRVTVPYPRSQDQMPYFGDHVTWLYDAVMMEEMYEADLVITSCGRTVHEAAACGTPVVAIAVNDREKTHVHVDGVVYAGAWLETSTYDIVETIAKCIDEGPYALSCRAHAMRMQMDGKGAQRIAYIIEGYAEDLF